MGLPGRVLKANPVLSARSSTGLLPGTVTDSASPRWTDPDAGRNSASLSRPSSLPCFAFARVRDTLDRQVTDSMRGSSSVHPEVKQCVGSGDAVCGGYVEPGRVARSGGRAPATHPRAKKTTLH
jgi:hypothetical protein